MARAAKVARLGPEHISDGILSIETEKTGTWVYIEVTDEFADLLKKSGLNFNPDTVNYSFPAKTLMGMTKEGVYPLDASMNTWHILGHKQEPFRIP